MKELWVGYLQLWDDGSSMRNLLMSNVLFPHVCLQVKSPSSLPAMPHMPKPLSFDNIIQTAALSLLTQENPQRIHHSQQKRKLLSQIECKCLPTPKPMYLHTDGEGQAQGGSEHNDSWGWGQSPFIFHLMKKFSRQHTIQAMMQPQSL